MGERRVDLAGRAQVSMKIPADLLDAIETRAKEAGISRNLLIARLLRSALDEPNYEAGRKAGAIEVLTRLSAFAVGLRQAEEVPSIASITPQATDG